MRKSARGILGLTSLIVLVSTPFLARAQTAVHFNIPAQALADSLRAVGSQTATDILFDPQLVAGRQAPALRADLTANQALMRLLAGTGIGYKFINETTVVLAVPVRADPAAVRKSTGTAKAVAVGVASLALAPLHPAAAAAASGPAGAVSTPVPPAPDPTPNDAADPLASAASLQQVVVTGTRFSTPNASSPAPITIVGAADLLHQGTAKVEDLMNSLPQVNSGLTDSANGAGVAPITGTATVDLRGIGAFRTLVLMNGRRINPGDATNPSADLHTIPELLIKRVEVLTGGASAIYGSDAIAGVVNFVMDDHFVGSKVTVQGSGYYGSNDNSGIQGIMRSSGVNPPTGSAADGKTFNVTGVYGTDFAGDAGHIEAYAGYRHNGGIAGSRRDFSSCTLQETGTSYSCLLDGTASAGQFVPYDATGTTPGSPYTLGAGGNTLRPFDPVADAYNVAPLETLLRPDTRYNAGVFAQYRLDEHAQAYLEAQVTNDHTTVQYEPSGTTATANTTDPTALNLYTVPCGDPLLSPGEVSILCTQNGLGPADSATVGIGRRNVEAGLLQDSFRHTSYRMVLGLKGAINDDWSYDASVNYGKVTSHERLSNDVSASRVANALNVVSVNGKPTCQSVVDGSDAGCVPYDIWTTGAVSPAALAYITEGGQTNGFATQTVFNAQVIGDLGRYGLKSPWANDALGLAVGTEYRDEVTSNHPGETYLSGDLMTMGSARPTVGSFHVSEVFGELKVPLLKDLPFAESLNLDLADRYASYRPQGGANAYNLGADWAPVRVVRLRTSYSQAIRAPNGHELFFAQNLSKQPIADPCSGPAPSATAAQCALTGVTAAEYGHIPAGNSLNVVTGGNPNLKPEIAKTLTVGVVFTNFAWAPSLLFSVDYWRIRINRYIGQISASSSLANCIAGGNPIFCGTIIRGAGGSLASGNSLTSGFVNQGDTNTGKWGESGLDLEGQYILPLHSAGTLTFTFDGTRALDNPIAVDPSASLVDCTDLYGPTCTGEGPTSPVPNWRHSLRATWALRSLEVSLNWRYIGSMSFEGASAYSGLNGETVYPVDARVPAYSYFDLDAGFDVSSRVNIHVGVNNFLDKRPPIVGYFSNPLLVNGNMLAGMYDPFGREIFAEATARF